MNDPANFNPVPGRVERLEPGIRRVLAPNPSPMTFRGTNTYIVGEGAVAVIDPGPPDRRHLDSLLAALAPRETVSHILVTHSHLDHSPLAQPLSRATGAPVLAFGNSRAGRSALMDALAGAGLTGGGEGADPDFEPHETLADGDVIEGGDWRLDVLSTPGHFGNHLCFALGDAVFTGDHIMAWSTSLVSPPDGDLTAFMASTRRLAARTDRVYYPGHGAPVDDPAGRARWLIAHRLTRETAILAGLPPDGIGIPALTRTVYHDTPPHMLPAAERNVFAHLVDLHGRNLVRATPSLSFSARYSRPG
jgi:glyoxylase-like metal-dependent hydrolase (beta-lactamase superfamily II)